MIEQELLEQIADEDWPLARCLDLIAPHKEPWPVLAALHGDGCILFRDGQGETLPDWKIEQALRDHDFPPGVHVLVGITERGLKRAFE